MALRKKEYSQTALSELSCRALERIEQLDVFRGADSFAIYHAMPDEVQTASFIRKWASRKTIYLPVICKDRLELHPYQADDSLKPGVFGILEPIPGTLTEKPKPDLIIVPGVAFDREMNRMGRGKGYYDKLLVEPELQNTARVGLCFSLQLVPEVPVCTDDVKMDLLITDEEVISPTVDISG